MIELVDTLPDINVQPAEYKRLLGYPRDRVLDGRARELAEWARAWYAKQRPAVGLRPAGRDRCRSPTARSCIDGVAVRQQAAAARRSSRPRPTA